MTPSRTAEYMALFRAIESARAPASRLFVDPIAPQLLPPSLRLVATSARVPGLRALIPRAIDRRWPGTRPSAVVRTRFIDDALAAGIDGGIRQVLVLGAGFDSRAVRVAGVERARVIEIDQRATQLEKRARLTRALADLPAHLSFVAVDFERDDLGAALDENGFRRDEPSFAIWEGVTNYLTADAVDHTFRLLARVLAPRSGLVFTYVHRGALDGTTRFEEADRWVAAVRHAGEPWTFGFDPAELPAYLAERGFALDHDISTFDAGVEYLEPLGRREQGSRLYRVAVASRAQGC